jgi:hypothetical protein
MPDRKLANPSVMFAQFSTLVAEAEDGTAIIPLQLATTAGQLMFLPTSSSTCPINTDRLERQVSTLDLARNQNFKKKFWNK